MNVRDANLCLRVALAFVWILTGVLCIRGTDEGRALIARVGLEGTAATWVIRFTSAFEIALGLAVISGKWRRAIAAIQIVLMLSFTAIITLYLPEWWLHPFGAISKNVVLIAAAAVTGWLQDAPVATRAA